MSVTDIDVNGLKLEIIRKISESADLALLVSIQHQLLDEEAIVGQQEGKPLRLKDLREDIEQALASSEAGRIHSHDAVRAHFKNKYKA